MQFDQPVGSPEDRDSNAWSGGWVDANPIGTRYQNPATGLEAFHTGADLNCNVPFGDADAHAPVYASADGAVVFAGQKPVWKNIIVIRHVADGQTIFTRYAHVENILVQPGQSVARGQQIAQVGNANGTMAYHLHFDVSFADLAASPGDWPGTDLARLNRDYTDPKNWINAHKTKNKEIKMTTGKMIVKGTEGDGLNIRAATATTSAKIGWLAEGEQVNVTETQGEWSKIELLNTSRQSFASGWSRSAYLQAIDPRPALPSGKPLMGINSLDDFSALKEAEASGCKFALIMNGVSEAVNFARAHPDGYAMLRRFIEHGRLTAADFIQQLGIAADMPSNLVITLFNEADSWGSQPSELEERMRVETDFVKMARDKGFRGIIALGTFSVGNPQFAPNAPEFVETCRLINKYYMPLWNTNQIGLDYHAYSPTADHINKSEDLFWFERRWEGFFRYCGLDPQKGQGVFLSECGIDEDNVGGFTAHNLDAGNISAWMNKFAEAQSLPLTVDGKDYPSPVKGCAIFCYGNNGDPRWATGYDIRGFGSAPFKNANLW